jgi:hypothetical protein
MSNKIEGNEIGHLTVMPNTPEERIIPIINRFTCALQGDRLAMVCKLDNEEGYLVEIKNPIDSGRSNPNMFLSKISLVGIQAALNLYSLAAGWDVQESIDSVIGYDKFDYYIQGDGLADPFKKDTDNEQ